MSAMPEPSVQPISFELLGRGRGEHDVGAADDDRPAEPLPVRRPCVQGDDGGAGPYGAAGRLGEGGVAGAETGDRGVLEEPHAALHQHAAHPAREARGMHRRAHLPEQRAAEHRRGDARAHLLSRQDLEVLVDAEPVGGDDAVGPPADLIVGGGHDVLAVGAVPGVDPVVFAEASDRLARCPRRPRRARSRLGRRTVARGTRRRPRTSSRSRRCGRSRRRRRCPARGSRRRPRDRALVRWRAVHMPV